MKEIYEALRSSHQWNEILLLVIYDEHGGFHDHVPTPTSVPSPNEINGLEPYNFKFDHLGCRVPTIIISPWIERGTGLRSLNLEKQTWTGQRKWGYDLEAAFSCQPNEDGMNS